MSGAGQASENPPSKLSSAKYEAATVEELGGLQTYIAGPRDSKTAIILLSDAYGYEGPKIRRLAENVAEETGFLVVVPDFFRGDPIDSIRDRAEWLRTHTADKGCEDAMAVIAALKSKGVSTIGVAGFCWGGMTVVKLARYDSSQVAVILHPGPITEDDIREVKVPIALLGAETDHLCPPELLTKLNGILTEKPEVNNFLKIYPGVKHGWTLQYSDDDEFAVKMAKEAHTDMLNWLTKHVK
ncbi:endo-1,3;1,4-beta-D-glucanase-like [Coffea arabica]|uniref:Endo-1,31,4-beta-D-glucanase-like n=1 Tax=Coffea arabica TaxID=13443 RepID=A0A6P6WL57_COFAR